MIRQIIHATVMGEEGMGKETVQEGGRREYKLVYKGREWMRGQSCEHRPVASSWAGQVWPNHFS